MNISEKTFDARGLFCPEPVFRTKIELEKMQVGDLLTVLADDPAAEDDISRWVNRQGHELVKIDVKENEIEFLIKKVK